MMVYLYLQKGSAVVDYIAMSPDNFNNYDSFCGESCADITSKSNLQSSVGISVKSQIILC